MDRSLWTELGVAHDPARFGHKAATLARLLDGGMPVVAGWVLDIETAAAALDDAAILDRAIHQLLDHAGCARWILRSSSVLEDQPGQSAAGWFASRSADASVDELARALRVVLRSAREPRLLRRIGGPVPLAVLAQPHLRLELWCAVESRAGDRFYEGWTGDEERWTSTHSQDFDPVVRAAVARTGIEPALLELGLHDGAAWILQLRPAPSRAPRRDRVAPLQSRFAGLGAQVHAGDADRKWVADLEHCPTPLSVLLATAFGRWIEADPGHTSSRLIQGRWHDPAAAPAPTDREAARSAWERWRHQLAERVQPALRGLDGALPPDTDPASWRRFHHAWFALQAVYFAMPGAGARGWARQQLAGDRVALAHTPSAGRARRWNALRVRLLAHEDPPATSAEAIAHWVGRHADDPLASEIRATAERDRAVAPLPYDGFTPGLDEDPWPLYRALAHGFGEAAATGPRDEDDELAAAILALAETDNEMLLHAYALWRAAIRAIAADRGLDAARDLHMLDIYSFEDWLQGGEFPAVALLRGRALHAAWSQLDPVDGSDGDTLRGKAAAGGTARGPVERGPSLLELESDGRIAVVDTLGPADAIAVPRFAAIVCVAGDVLGHASVLCREYGVPCVVDVRAARQRLARARELFVDGDHGVVRILA